MNPHAPRAARAQDRAQKLEALDRVPREVYDLLAASPTPLKAYKLLWRLQEKRGRRAPPSTIYRAASVLIDLGLIHRIESRNAYVICTGAEGEHTPIFLVCERCERASEIAGDAVLGAVRTRLHGAQFRARHLNFVVTGVCRECADERRD